MTYEETDLLLTLHGWILCCWSPLEIQHMDDPQSTATGYAAQLIIDQLATEEPEDE